MTTVYFLIASAMAGGAGSSTCTKNDCQKIPRFEFQGPILRFHKNVRLDGCCILCQNQLHCDAFTCMHSIETCHLKLLTQSFRSASRPNPDATAGRTITTIDRRPQESIFPAVDYPLVLDNARLLFKITTLGQVEARRVYLT